MEAEEDAANALRICTTSDPTAAAGAIAKGVCEEGGAEIHVIGPRAVNQAVKAIAIARGYLAPNGIDAYFVPSFASVSVAEGEDARTAIHFRVSPRHDPRTPAQRGSAE